MKNDQVQNPETLKKILLGIYQEHMHISLPWQKQLQSFKQIYLQL